MSTTKEQCVIQLRTPRRLRKPLGTGCEGIDGHNVIKTMMCVRGQSCSLLGTEEEMTWRELNAFVRRLGNGTQCGNSPYTAYVVVFSVLYVCMDFDVDDYLLSDNRTEITRTHICVSDNYVLKQYLFIYR
jgi:hypothetical protein